MKRIRFERFDAIASRIGITARTLGGFFIQIFFFACLAIFWWYQLDRIENSAANIDRSLTIDLAVSQINSQLHTLNNSARRFLHSRDFADVAAAREGFKKAHSAFLSTVSTFNDEAIISAHRSSLEKIISEYGNVLEQTVAATAEMNSGIDRLLSSSMPIANISQVVIDQALLSKNDASAEIALRLANRFHSSRSALTRYALTLQPSDIAPAQEELKRFEGALADLRSRAPSKAPGLERLLDVFRLKAPEYIKAGNNLFDIVERKITVEKSLGRTILELEQVVGALESDLTLYRTGSSAVQTDKVDVLKRTLAVAASGEILIAVLMAWLIGGSIVRPIRKITRSMQALSQGHLGTEIPALGHRDEIGKMAGALEVFRESTFREKEAVKQLALAHEELAQKNALLETLSITDKLTGLFNRRRLDELLEKHRALSSRTQTHLSVILADIDHFKRINDSRGHAAGDVVLQQIAEVFRKSQRKTDTSGRWGGEEFVIICPATRIAGAVNLAEKIREKIEAHGFPDNQKVTCSFGVASFKVGDTPEALMKRADMALYEAKTNGRNRVETISSTE